MSTNSEVSSVCQRISAALERNGFQHVQCEHTGKEFRLFGTVAKEEDRAIAYALARTTIGIEKIANAIVIDG
jgi:osmotically-inducible protein OsmY